MKRWGSKVVGALLLSSLVACDGGGATGGSGGAGGSGASGGAGGATGGSGGAGGSGASGGSGGAGGAQGGAGGAQGGSGGSAVILDPTVAGPYTTTTVDDTVAVAATGNMVPVHAVFPSSGPSAGPYPVVLVLHGFQLPPSQYYGYCEHLASFGYVAIAPDYPTSLFSPDNPAYAADALGALDWAATAPALAGKADTTNAGATGHSLGGKIALLAATMDPRIQAAITLDPVDGGGGPGGQCNPPGCVDVSALLPSLQIPTGFLGETTDAMGGFQPCAPAAENFQTFYATATSPSLAVTVAGANHMSFLDDPASCGFTCNFCNMATADHAAVIEMSHAYVVAFYERHLRGLAGYDDWLTGAAAQQAYGALISIQSK